MVRSLLMGAIVFVNAERDRDAQYVAHFQAAGVPHIEVMHATSLDKAVADLVTRADVSLVVVNSDQLSEDEDDAGRSLAPLASAGKYFVSFSFRILNVDPVLVDMLRLVVQPHLGPR
jgi:hypothetical protein